MGIFTPSFQIVGVLYVVIHSSIDLSSTSLPLDTMTWGPFLNKAVRM